MLPTRFTHLMPKLKASDYDYIIFDMPPVTQTSATPRLASYMELALLVLESEKTRQHAAARASALMRESRANVAAVLNKYRPHVPAALSQDLTGAGPGGLGGEQEVVEAGGAGSHGPER